jgi:hypothetical protein
MSLREKVRLAMEIVLAYVKARWYLWRRPLPDVVARLRRVEPRIPVRDPLLGDQGVRLGRAVTRTLRPLPTDSRCLVRSLVLLRLLARRGVSAAVVIAARPAQTDQFGAHAWVEVGGTPVLPPAGSDYGRLVTL